MSSPKQHEDLSLLLSAGAAQEALAAHLDGLDPAQRIREVRSLSGRALGQLFERCGGAPPFTLLDLVPAEVPGRQPVVYAGKNSLPLFSHFEKHFTRLPGGAVAGFNFQKMSFVTGPGYFLVIERPGQELLFDYTQVPAPAHGEVPAGWPAVRDNRGVPSRLVFGDLHDLCRRVSQDVLIGQATRLGKPMGQHFVLARAPRL